jgi:hypothetical protein
MVRMKGLVFLLDLREIENWTICVGGEMKRAKTEVGNRAMRRIGTEVNSPSVDQLQETDGIARDLAVVVRELEEFLDPDVISDWLLTEQFSLGGRTPIQALRDGDLAEVLHLVNATEHGAYI